MASTTDRAVLSVDFEFFEHTPAYRSARGNADRTDIGIDAAEYLLTALSEHDADATFFLVSEIADRHPEVVRSLADQDHEIGSHSRTHRLLSTLDSGERRSELLDSRRTLERVSDRRVRGFRAPAFDLPTVVFDELVETGYEYDSSIAPCRHVPGWYGGEHRRRRPGPASAFDQTAPDTLLELPVAVMPGFRLPLTGAWVRLLGVRWALWGMRLLARQGVAPVLYVHPWELVDLPPVDGVPKRVYWRTGTWMRRAVERLLDAPFEFVSAAAEADRHV